MTPREVVFPDVACDGVVVLHMLENMSDITWQQIWDIHREEWQDTVTAYEADPFDFCYAWNYLNKHPAFWEFRHGPADPNPLPLARRVHVKNLNTDFGIMRCVDIDVVKVNPDSRSIEDDKPNTHTEVWIELGHQSWPKEFDPTNSSTCDAKFHDYRLDCGGSTVERAIIRAAYYVHAVYGNDRRVCDGPFDEAVYAAVTTADGELIDPFTDDAEISRWVRVASACVRDLAKEALADEE